MSELKNRLERLSLRLDHMGMRVEQALIDALAAVENSDIEAGQTAYDSDEVIDREEVEIEQECIRLLALYQPAAIDLRTICTIIKVNNDLERIADLAAGFGRKVRYVIEANLALESLEEFVQLKQDTLEILGRTTRILNVSDTENARRIIEFDARVDEDYKRLLEIVLDSRRSGIQGSEGILTTINLAKGLERIGDLCTNIAEDIIFLRTGDIVRHTGAFDEEEAG